MDLRGASVFIDFDGTITTADVCVHLLETLAPASWRVIEGRYLTGAIGSRQCMVEQWALLPRDRALIEATPGRSPSTPGSPPWWRISDPWAPT